MLKAVTGVMEGRSLSELAPGFVYQVDRVLGEQLTAMRVAIEVRSTDPTTAESDDERVDLVRLSGGVHVVQTDRAADRSQRRRKRQ